MTEIEMVAERIEQEMEMDRLTRELEQELWDSGDNMYADDPEPVQRDEHDDQRYGDDMPF